MEEQAVQQLIAFEIEEAVLGSLLVTGNMELASQLRPSDFGMLKNRQVFEAIRSLAERDLQVDFITVSDELKRHGTHNQAGGDAYLTRLVGTSATMIGAVPDTYANRLRDYARRRLLLASAQELAQAALNLGAEPNAAADQVMSNLALDVMDGGGAHHWKSDLAALYDWVEQRSKNPGEVFGVTTGLRDIDRITGGLQIGENILIAGAPGLGKSILGNQLGIVSVLLGEQTGAAIYSLEMRSIQVCLRNVSALAKVPTRKLKTGLIDADEWQSFTNAIGEAEQLPIYLYPKATLTTAQLRADLTRLHKAHGVTVFVLDYMLLMTDEVKGMNDNERSAFLSRKVLPLAKDLGMVGILIHPMLKSGIDGDEARLSDVRGGQVLYDADNVWVMTKPSGYSAIDSENIREIGFKKGREEGAGQSVTLIKHPLYPWFLDADKSTLNLDRMTKSDVGGRKTTPYRDE